MSVDRDRQKVYDTESFVFDDTAFDEQLTFTDACEFADAIMNNAFWTGHGLPTVAFGQTRRDSKKSFARDAREVRLATGGCRAHIVVHELAHIAAQHTRTGAGHDAGFRAWQVALARVVFGDVTATRLDGAFRQAGIAPGVALVAADATPVTGPDVWSSWWQSSVRADLRSHETATPFAL